MAKQILNIGSSANDGSGTTLRAGGDLINDNFNEIYTTFGDGTNLTSPAIPHKIGGTNFARSIIIGHSTTGTINSAEDNLAIGDNALNSVTSGDQNVVLGSNAGTAITTASANVYIGRNSGSSNATGNSNFGLGVDSLEDVNFSGTGNVAIGRGSGSQMESANNNIVIGLSAGDNITTGDGNVIIGAQADAPSATGDRQLVIGGYDGSTTTTWLSGDSSGNLTTVGDVTLANNKKVIFGDAGENIVGDGTNLTISSSAKTIVDSTGDIELDAASGVIDFINSGTVFGNVAVATNDLVIKSRINDGDISLRGNDGGSEVIALTLDMSDAGSASFNNDAYFGDNGKIKLGASSDLQIYHDGSNSYIKDTGTGALFLNSDGTKVAVHASGEKLGEFNLNGSVDLYHNNTKRFETTADGISVTNHIALADDGELRLGTDNDMQIYHSGTSGFVKNTTGTLILQGSTVRIQDAGSSQTAISAADGVATLYHTNTAVLNTTAGGIQIEKGVQEKFHTVTGASGVTALDCSNGHIFYKTGCTGDITANFTNLTLTAEYAVNLMVIINQGGTPYEVTAVQIGGSAQTLNWQGGSQPTGNANGIDAFSFTILNDGGSYVVLGQMVDFT